MGDFPKASPARVQPKSRHRPTPELATPANRPANAGRGAYSPASSVSSTAADSSTASLENGHGNVSPVAQASIWSV
ncbi:hypothetical protein GCM10023169_14110 [Georgenia halophila]|uniref:Uncharacterized protein n=1 Tax=Georgenia halophila TaxID=620889 RepID=A0ABP8L3A1_9MICO